MPGHHRDLLPSSKIDVHVHDKVIRFVFRASRIRAYIERKRTQCSVYSIQPIYTEVHCKHCVDYKHAPKHSCMQLVSILKPWALVCTLNGPSNAIVCQHANVCECARGVLRSLHLYLLIFMCD